MTGYELDCTVALVVFRAKCVKLIGDEGFRDGSVEFVPRIEGTYCYTGPTDITLLPLYSTDLRHSWLVVSRMRSMGFGLYILDMRPDRDEYLVQFRDGSTATGTSKDGNINWAICMAALEACGV